MSACFHALHDHNIGARFFSGTRLGDGRDIGKPDNAGLFQPGDERGRIQTHHRRNDRRLGGEQCLALRREVRRRRVACARREPAARNRSRNARTCVLVRLVTARRRIGNPQIELIGPVAFGAHFIRPSNDLVGLHQQRAASTEAAGVHRRDRQGRCRHSRHRRQHDRHLQSEAPAKGFGAPLFGRHGQLLPVPNARLGTLEVSARMAVAIT